MNRNLSILAAVAVSGALQAAEPWNAPLPQPGVPTEPRTLRIVDYGDDYCRYRSDQFLLSKTYGALGSGVDLDGDEAHDDTVTYTPFQLDDFVPLKNSGVRHRWHHEAVSGRMYVFIRGDAQDYDGRVDGENGGRSEGKPQLSSGVRTACWKSQRLWE